MKTAAAIFCAFLISSAAEGWEIRCPAAPERQVTVFSSPFLSGGWNAAIEYQDAETLRRMESQGVVAYVPAGTAAYPLDEPSGETRRVHIQEGSRKGEAVYVPRACLVKEWPTPRPEKERPLTDKDSRLPDRTCEIPPCRK